MTTAVLPRQVAPYAGRIVDSDSHELMPAQIWVDTFGEIARPIAELIMSRPSRNKNAANIPGYTGEIPLDPAALWTTKGPESPGASDMTKRLEVMDLMGIKSQMLFATSVGLWGISLV